MTLAIDIKIDDNATPALQKLTPAIIQRRGEGLADIASFVQAQAIQFAYEGAKYARTGDLARSIIVNVNAAQGRASVRADRRIASYASAVEIGQRPHAIPNNPAWGLRGKIHTGAQGKFYMYRGGLAGAKIAPQVMRERVRMAVRDVGLQLR